MHSPQSTSSKWTMINITSPVHYLPADFGFTVLLHPAADNHFYTSSPMHYSPGSQCQARPSSSPTTRRAPAVASASRSRLSLDTPACHPVHTVPTHPAYPGAPSAAAAAAGRVRRSNSSFFVSPPGPGPSAGGVGNAVWRRGSTTGANLLARNAALAAATGGGAAGGTGSPSWTGPGSPVGSHAQTGSPNAAVFGSLLGASMGGAWSGSPRHAAVQRSPSFIPELPSGTPHYMAPECFSSGE